MMAAAVSVAEVVSGKTRQPPVTVAENITRDAPAPAIIAQECLDVADGDVVKATDAMVDRLKNDVALYRAVMDPLLRSACYAAVADRCRKGRGVIWHTQQPTAEQQRGRIIALAQGTANSLLDFPLPGGKRLRAASRADVAAAAEFYSLQSKDMRAKAGWLALVVKHTPADQLVGDVLNNDRLAQLRAQAERAIAPARAGKRR